MHERDHNHNHKHEHDPERALARRKHEFGEHGGLIPSIERAATFTVMHPGTMPEIFAGKLGPGNGGCFLYSRHFNPTNSVLADALAAMEGTERAVCTASGISAIACALSQLCFAGDHIVSSEIIYGGSHALLADLFPGMGISTTFVNPADPDAFRAALTPKTKVVFTEAVGNPTLAVADLPALADLAHRHGAKLVVDNTFTPLVVSPARLGADVVVYSMTKFINGASDLIAGAICGDDELIASLMDLRTGRVMLFGPTIDPRASFDIYQRLAHLPMRMREHGQRAMAIATRLEELGVSVRYPGLASHPEHDLFARMHNPRFGFGGMLTLDCATQDKANEVMEALQNDEDFGYLAVSLGSYDTLISCSGSSTSSEIPAAEQRRMGLSPGLLRIAVGYTGTLEDRLAQIERVVVRCGLAR